jgi:hypothetical protein
MLYRGREYTIGQGPGRRSWKWTVQLDEQTVRTGEANSREAARIAVGRLIDKSLMPKNAKN